MGDTTTTRQAETEGRADIYQRITDQIAAAIEAGAGKWRMPWHPGADGATPVLPVNAATGKPYRGVNTVVPLDDGAHRGLSERGMGDIPAVGRAWGAGPQR